MHYRITKMSFDPSKRDALMAYADSVRDDMKAIPGIQSVTIVEVAEGEIMGVAAYDSQANAEAAAPTVMKIMGGMASFFTAPPDQKDGGVMWSM